MSEIEDALRTAWVALFGQQGDPNGDFFELGGNSLMAIQLISLIQEDLQCELELSDVFDCPTIPELARRIHSLITCTSAQRDKSIAARSGLMPIGEILDRQLAFVRTWKGARGSPESFIVTLNDSVRHHGLFWCLQGYRELTQLALHLGSSQPVHGMRSGHLVMRYTDENVYALASHYAAEMIALQPDGPFLLGGNCQGGIIARAIAQRLRELDRVVSLLILMEQDSFPPYEGPVALIFGCESHFNPYKPDADPDTVFRSSYPAGFTVDIISGAHGKFFESPNVDTLASAVNGRLSDSSLALGLQECLKTTREGQAARPSGEG